MKAYAEKDGKAKYSAQMQKNFHVNVSNRILGHFGNIGFAMGKSQISTVLRNVKTSFARTP